MARVGILGISSSRKALLVAALVGMDFSVQPFGKKRHPILTSDVVKIPISRKVKMSRKSLLLNKMST